MPDIQATAIVQCFLDERVPIVLKNNWDALCCALCRPFTVITPAKTLTFPTPDGIRVFFDRLFNMLPLQSVTAYFRPDETAVQIDQNRITARDITQLILRSMRIIPPAASQFTPPRPLGNLWRAASITNDLSHSRRPLQLPRLDDEAL